MPTDNADINPYQSPAESAGQDSSQPEQAAASKWRFRWRMIPATLLYLYGALFMMGALAMVLGFSVSLARRTARFPTGESIFWLPLFAAWATMVGFTWLFAARALRQGRWWNGIVAFILGLAAVFWGSLLGDRLGL